MGQFGFFDADRRLAAITAKGDPLEMIARVVPFESFRAEIEAAVIAKPFRPRGRQRKWAKRGSAVSWNAASQNSSSSVAAHFEKTARNGVSLAGCRRCAYRASAPTMRNSGTQAACCSYLNLS
jgi:hypothetical protein